jgi:hypothetical protein
MEVIFSSETSNDSGLYGVISQKMVLFVHYHVHVRSNIIIMFDPRSFKWYFYFRFPFKFLFSTPHTCLIPPAHICRLDLMTLITFGEQHELWGPLLCNVFVSPIHFSFWSPKCVPHGSVSSPGGRARQVRSGIWAPYCSNAERTWNRSIFCNEI